MSSRATRYDAARQNPTHTNHAAAAGAALLAGASARLAITLLVALGTLAAGAPARAWPGTVAHVEGRARNPNPFPRPASLEGAVQFWRSIFTRYESHQTVLHDRKNMNVIWEVIPLPTDADGNVLEQQARARVRARTKALRQRLRQLAAAGTPQTPEDKILFSLVGYDADRIAGAAKRVRAQRGVADHFRKGLQRARNWLGKIYTILDAEGVPREIVALPFVESMFNPDARSSAGAAGLWQLMPGTAGDYGLRVNRRQDERLVVPKATRAAARLLRDNYEMLGTWPLAITGYNHGPYGVRRAVNELGSRELAYLIEHYKKSTWGFASKNFYAEFLAVLDILRELDPTEAAIAFESQSAAR
mgnify:CR=1 FL=1